MDFEQDIRERAYFIWLDSGYENDSADGHWLAAEAEILGAVMDVAGQVMAAPEKKRGSTRPKSTQRPAGNRGGESGQARKGSPVVPSSARPRAKRKVKRRSS